MFGLEFIKRKLDIMSGVLYNVEGIAKGVNRKIDTLSPVINNTGILTGRVLERVNETNDLLKRLAVEDHSDFYFSQIQIDNIIIKGRIEEITMNEFQQVSATYAAEKKDGRPAKVQNARLETDRPDVVEATLDEATQKITLRAKQGMIEEDTPVAVKVIADADLGEGVKEIEVVGALLITPGHAEKLTLNFEEPVDIVEETGEPSNPAPIE